MRFLIKHEVQGRLRIHVIRNRMTCTEADVLCWALEKQKSVIKVKVYERTADAVIYYTGDREELIHKLKKFHFEKADVPDNVLSSSGRALNSAYREKLIAKTLLHYGGKLLFGHPFLKHGSSNYFMHNASIFTVVKSYNAAFKLGSMGKEIGSVTEDRGAGIRCYSDWRVRAARRL